MLQVPDLSTFEIVDSELAATAGYDVENDVSLARRRVAALRRKLDFAASSGRDGQNAAFQQQIIQDQLNGVLAWLRANDTTLSQDQLMRDPSVLHADFSTLRGGGSCT